MTRSRALALALLAAVGAAACSPVAEVYEDGAAVFGVTWTAPECPDAADEPCYALVLVPAFDSAGDAVEIVTGP